ncbi:MAG: primosomal protein N' (replication factor Y) [Cyclobacteriaceae bacterium]
MYFAEVILPIPLPGTFTYVVPKDQWNESLVLKRVLVQFGKKKIYTGIVHSVHANESPYNPKEILEVLDENPLFTAVQMRFLQWMSTYYMCTIGEAINAALPSGLKISSESYLSINSEIEVSELDLTDREFEVLSILKREDKKYDDLNKALDIKSSYRYVKSLSEKGALDLFEQVKDKYIPKTEQRVRLDEKFLNTDELEAYVNSLETKPKQQNVLVKYLEAVNLLENPKANIKGMLKSELKNQVSISSINTLIKNNVFHEWNQVISRFKGVEVAKEQFPTLSNIQKDAFESILEQFEKTNTVLLHAVTGSGKTEIYISIIAKVLASGKQALLLLPEIALTTQMIHRLSKYFGTSFGIYHSRFSENERVEVWQKVLDGTFKFVVGVRSAVFLPFSNLGIIIVDEEHEPSYKQYDPAPRYHARDSAIVLANLFGAHILLGSATPSLESFYNALSGKYGLVEITKRYRNVSLPDIEFADLIREKKKKLLKGNFSSSLFNEIEIALAKKEQVILFQNRRGYAAFLDCDSCGHVPKCPNCDVSLSYHMHQNHLICHYCGFKNDIIKTCDSCGADELKTVSFGTEKLEEEVEILFPNARVRRMDLDTTRSKYSYQRIINDFEKGDIDILIGTQMVTKGLDFERVNLVGVFDTDRMIHFPDFRSHERAFQLMQQVSGRAGRKTQGKVIIQTNDPKQQLLAFIQNHDYQSFYRTEIFEREQFQFPPFFRIIAITIKDKKKEAAQEAAIFFTKEIRRALGKRVQGPTEPIISRIRNQYLFEVTVKIEKEGANLKVIKEFLLNSRNMVINQRWYKSVKIVFDVDPV